VQLQLLLLLPVELVMHGGRLLEISPWLPEQTVGHGGGVRIGVRLRMHLLIAGLRLQRMQLLQLLRMLDIVEHGPLAGQCLLVRQSSGRSGSSHLGQRTVRTGRGRDNGGSGGSTRAGCR